MNPRGSSKKQLPPLRGSGLISSEPECRSVYPQHQCQEVTEQLYEMNVNEPDISKLEAIGSGKPFTSTAVGPLLEKEEEEKEHQEIMKELLNPQAEQDDVQVKPLSVPALRIQGKLATWTGNSTARKGELGIRASFIFEAQTDEVRTSDVELYNEGNTAIFYHWEKQIKPPTSFDHLIKPLPVPFYLNFSSGVVLPGKTQRVECIYMAAVQGYQTELWHLKTHPVLMEGATIEVEFTGVASSPDKNKEKRLFLEQQLERKVAVNMCRSIVDKILDGVRTPERPSSPPELYMSERQLFTNKNPKLHYRYQPVEDLKSLWQKVNPGGIWDFSVETLYQAVMSYEEPPPDALTKAEALTELNSLYLRLSEPSDDLKLPLKPLAVLIETRLTQEKEANEAIRLRKFSNIPEMEMSVDGKQEFVIAESDPTHGDDPEKKAVAAAKEKSKEKKLKFKDDTKGQTKNPPSDMSTKAIKGKDDAGIHSIRLRKKGSALVTDMHPEAINFQPSNTQRVDPEMMGRYSNALRQTKYALQRELKDKLDAIMKDTSFE